jgi:hypothetical protein
MGFSVSDAEGTEDAMTAWTAIGLPHSRAGALIKGNRQWCASTNLRQRTYPYTVSLDATCTPVVSDSKLPKISWHQINPSLRYRLIAWALLQDFQT